MNFKTKFVASIEALEQFNKKTLKSIEDKWSRKLIQFQLSVYNDKSSVDFSLIFDTAIADAFVLGWLRIEAIVLPDETLQKIKVCGNGAD